MNCRAVFALLALASTSFAAPIPDSEMWDISPTSNSDGVKVAATPTRLPWCPTTFTGNPWATKDFKAAIRKHEDFDAWADAAEALCENRDDPTWVRQATNLVQRWMNSTGKPQADTEKEIAGRIAELKDRRSPAGQEKAEQAKFEFAPDELTAIDPEPGVEKAKIPQKAAWCDVIGPFPPADRIEHRAISRAFDGTYGIEGTIKAAKYICQRPTDTTWKQYSERILQKWMNWTRLNQADAERSLRARVQLERFDEQRTALCKTMTVGEEAGGQEKTYALARRHLFGCENKGQLLWQDSGSLNTGGVGYYLDADSQVDELMRVYWLFGFLWDPAEKTFPAKDASGNVNLLYYALAQSDLSKVDFAALEKQLQAEPYNEYARIAIMEIVSVLKARARVYETAVAKMTKGDPDYTAILIGAPKSGWAAWEKELKQWGPEIERSNAFEKLLSQPSRKVLKGCSVELTKDAQKLIKSFKATDFSDLTDQITRDPAANVVLRRVAWCYAVDGVYGGGGALRDVIQNGRNLRGPRSLVYYAIIDAIAEAKKDRPRLLIDFANFYANGGVLSGETYFDEGAFSFTGSAPSEWDREGEHGTVASVKKVEDGMQIEFKKVIATWPDEDCVDDVRHPMKISSDGRIVYYQFCKPNGKTVRQDNTPPTIVVHQLLAGGVKAGAFLRFVTMSKTSKGGKPLANVGYTRNKPADKKITSFLGFAL